MINKEYWDQFYKRDIAPKDESDFARTVMNYISENGLTSGKLIDIACGNGRDTFYFNRQGINSVGIDISVQPDSDQAMFIKNDIVSFDYSGYNLLYLRFIVHALREEELDELVTKILENRSDFMIFIETRSTKGITNERKSETFFKSSIGEEHFRMLYSKDYLMEKFSSHFELVSCEENSGFSVYKGDDPVCIRLIMKKKK